MDKLYDLDSVFFEFEEGMEVYDATLKKVGTLRYIQLPSAEIDPNLEDFPYDVSDAGLTVDVISRLLRTGFVSVWVGWLAKDRLVTPDKIDSITNGTLYLKVLEEELIAI